MTSATALPKPLSSDHGFVQLHVLSSGTLTLPESHFVQPAVAGKTFQVPCLSFLIQRRDPETGKIVRILFDLGLRKNLNAYSEAAQEHAKARQPMSMEPDVVQSLAAGAFEPRDVDYVIYSHVHWDHIGDPRDFADSTFVVGFGTLDLISNASLTYGRGEPSFFEADLFQDREVLELHDPTTSKPPPTPPQSQAASHKPDFTQQWKPFRNLPSTLDIFHDGSVRIVSAPGHLQGHINLLCRLEDNSHIYLAGDACHDRRIMRSEKKIGTWEDDSGRICCIHKNRDEAEETIRRIADLEREGVEVILGHDFEWVDDVRNKSRFWVGE